MINRVSLKNCVQLLFLSLAVLIIISCASSFPSPAPPPTDHVWQYLLHYGDEKHGYATYSYVLVGRDERNNEAKSLYLELVNAIQSSTIEVNILPQIALKSNFNIFLIPTKEIIGYTSHEPNYELSKLLLSALSTASSLRFSRPGPYIITLYKPISFGHQDEIVDILYIDLTNIHSAAIPEVVRTYKNKILSEKLNGIEKLKSLRLSILNLALITEDSIGFARASYAELRTAFKD